MRFMRVCGIKLHALSTLTGMDSLHRSPLSILLRTAGTSLIGTVADIARFALLIYLDGGYAAAVCG
ncbi:hypothetical protein [Rhizobium sp. PL01]|uniref:hypothetical protein n=1 Tax=Rhizobium sp. PL01 TaxID=3085631 RepID=UPI002981DB91|nr:hypothetical protein [Rhizobium sp. PL01]MDW5318353.1 hypothetical protein [Rhizobium sp. PL01]